MKFIFKVPLKEQMSGVWLTVVKGGIDVRLTPNEDCMEKFGCVEATARLQAGETG